MTAECSELAWIKAIKSGQTAAFQHLYQRYAAKIHALAYRFTYNSQDAEEQTQEIFMRLLDKIDSFNATAKFSSWFYRLATNHLISFKRKKRAQQVPLTEEHHPGYQGEPAIKVALEHAIQQLPRGYRSVLILHDQEGFRHDEIAEILNISVGTSKSQLSRARMNLRQQLCSQEPWRAYA